MNTIAAIKPISWIKFFSYGILLLGIYYSTLIYLVTKDWQRDGYSYANLIPFVVLYLIWMKRDDLGSLSSIPSWKGIIPIILGIFFFWLGDLSGEYLTLYLSFWLIIVGLCWSHLGWQKLKSIGFALFFTLTMFPLPYFLHTKVMLQLRLISSKLGVSIIQLYGLSAYREGNIIDLGFTQLQVVEACSGLHSLISLVVLSLLLVYFFKAHLWKRVVLLVSSVPLAILTNSIRIAMTSILFKHFGAEIAQGFFHGFSGLLIFVFCIPVLLIEMKILDKLPPDGPKPASPAPYFKKQSSSMNPAQAERKIFKSEPIRQSVFIAAVILLVATFVFSHSIEFREKIPLKRPLNQFPLEVAKWSAVSRQSLDPLFINQLDSSDYAIMDYHNSSGKLVNFYVNYYESQGKRESIHSPATCLPGSGWSFDQFGEMSISNIKGKLSTLRVNRAVMQLGSNKKIAYYWFPHRGRMLNNAYQLKIYNFWDALTMQRTDGALVRLITPVYKNEKVADAEARLQNFVRDIVPVLEEYIPGKELAHSQMGQ